MQILWLLFFFGSRKRLQNSLVTPEKNLLFAQAAVKKRCDGAAVHAASDKY